MKRQIKNMLKRKLFKIYKFGTSFGVHVLPVHYYSALPDIFELERTKDNWAKKSDLPGLGTDIDQQVVNCRNICMSYQSECAGNRIYKYAVNKHFGPGYGYIEAQALHAVIRYYKPKRIIEVGGGVSTYCMLTALKMNKEKNNEDFFITCIEPHPSTKLKSLKKIKLILKKVQTIPFEVFNQLHENDFLFIDSSHTVKPGSDVNYLILEILPRLNPGVIVHFHDVYLPYDYPRSVLQTFFQWMETSLLRAFLIHNNKAKIIFCQSHLHYDRKDALKEVFPEYNPQLDKDGLRHEKYKPFENPMNEHFPSSIYIQIQ